MNYSKSVFSCYKSISFGVFPFLDYAIFVKYAYFVDFVFKKESSDNWHMDIFRYICIIRYYHKTYQTTKPKMSVMKRPILLSIMAM